MTDPRTPLSPDQRDVIDALEQVALLPDDVTVDELQPVTDRAIDVLKWRVQQAWDRDALLDGDLIYYEHNLRKDGFYLASDGAARLLARLQGEIARPSNNN
jgi:hypothetical protein